MQHQPLTTPFARHRELAGDALLAVVLAGVLTLGWASMDWPQLHRLLLPDPDDMMRLAQIRDWIAGQATNDWTQYRMAPPAGAPMHWSRINDLIPAAVILLLKPLMGSQGSEVVAILAYPAMLFTAAILLSARIARRCWGASAGPIAAVLTALAYPGTTVFIPGRIDHHALQVVLVQGCILALMRPAGYRAGALAGLTMALSLLVGLETAPQVAALTGVLALTWVVRGMAERARLAGAAAALGATTLVFYLFLRPTYWTADYCDAFTPAAATGMFSVAAALGGLAMATPWLKHWPLRLIVGTLAGCAALAGSLIAFPVCLTGPYGAMDPFLQTAFLSHIDEANGIGAQTNLARAISLVGVLTAASIATMWMVGRAPQRWRVHAPIAAAVLASAAVTLFQVRGTYIGAPLGAAVLAGVVLAARRRTTYHTPSVILAWLSCAGLAYLEIPKAIERVVDVKGQAQPGSGSGAPRRLCGSGDVWQQVDRFPAGTVMASTNIAPYLVGATGHATVGAGYHRNDSGNMAMYRFFLSPPGRAEAMARGAGVRYVAFCPGDFAEIEVASSYPESLATALAADRPPPWLGRVSLRDTHLRFYRVAR